MTRAEYETWARERLAEAFAADPIGANDAVVTATGGEAFAWSALSVAQLRTLSALASSICLAARG